MLTDPATFLRIIDATPLVSIDLVVRNAAGAVLLGYRNNRPAQHSWFVPGGRIRKNETLHAALGRIATNELGLALPPEQGRLLGVFDHLYADNALDAPGIGTHYVVCAYTYTLDAAGEDGLRPDQQHSALRWWPVPELLASEAVHANTKLYFQPVPGNGFRCTNS